MSMSARITRRSLSAAATLLLAGTLGAQQTTPITDPTVDPRVGLKAGWLDAGTAARHMELVATRPRPEGFFDRNALGNLALANSDLAFRGNVLFLGNFSGIQTWDIADPANPALIHAMPCPGGQGDVSIHGHLLFMSVEATNGRIDCGTQGAPGAVNKERFRGVRIFDVTDLKAPKQVGFVQTCRGSHTHTLVPDPRDAGVVYVYVSGTSIVRSNEELAGCSDGTPDANPNTALFRIDVIRVPIANPADAHIVSTPRIFADRETGNIAGLWPGGTHGAGTQQTSVTNQCHDITVYPEIGLAAGACSGNGILLDIRDPANPKRVDEVLDKNFAYWHSATFNNDGTSVLFTDEWGGGTSPRCRATDLPEWGANAIFSIVGGKMQLRSYYKIPAAQTATENCVAHNGSLVPVPGRDIKVQAWYQGGVSVFDFTDPAKPLEIAFFDRGPMSDTDLLTSGYWSTYWYNGAIYGSEIGRGLDVLRLLPSEHLTQHELDAARLVREVQVNPQLQTRIEWPAEFVVARAYLDQLARGTTVPAARLTALRSGVDQAERAAGTARRQALETLAGTATELARTATGRDALRLTSLAETLRGIAVKP
jgi:hypothetical protein